MLHLGGDIDEPSLASEVEWLQVYDKPQALLRGRHEFQWVALPCSEELDAGKC